MQFLKEYSSFSLQKGDKVLIHYWWDGMITPVKIEDVQGRKYLVSHNVSESKIWNAPKEWVKKRDIIDHYRK